MAAPSLEKIFAVDVAIVGGGPAGAAAALTLLKHSSLRVAVVEKSYEARIRVGETVAPGLQPLLDYLGVWEAFTADEHLPAYGTSAAWGSPDLLFRDFLFTGRGHGWLLNRRRFDLMLAAEVVKRGGRLFTEARLAACTREATGRWQLSIARQNQEPVELMAHFIIDASGKRAYLAQRFGGRKQVYDHLTGVIGFYEFPDREVRSHFTLVEACADGWWYSAPLPGQRMVVAFMSDADLIRRGGVQQPQIWQGSLATTQHTRQSLTAGSLTLPLIVRPAHSHVLQPASGTGWAAAGDAAAAFDPLSSMGIGHAVASGIHAARVAHDQLALKGRLTSEYTINVARNFQKYLERRRDYYQIERRWHDRPFWARRHHFSRG